MIKKRVGLLLFFGLLIPPLVYAASGTQENDPLAGILFWVTLIFILAFIGRYLAQRCHQPGVIGELLIGILISNAGYFCGVKIMAILREGSAIYPIMGSLLTGASLTEAVNNNVVGVDTYPIINALSGSYGLEYLKAAYVLDVFARYGLIYLLFMVGLESSIAELKHTGCEAFKVALIGVIAPIILGFGVAYLLAPDASYQANLFVAATLCATSIGITARVLTEINKLQTSEAKIILGAAMLDDILGLIILAIVSSIVINGHVEIMMIVQVVLLTLIFFAASLLLGPIVLRGLISWLKFLDVREAKLVISFLFVMVLAWLATQVKLASIIGAFTAGLIIKDSYFDKAGEKFAVTIKELISPLESLLAPLFFVLIGMQVKIETFLNWQIIFMAGGLIIAAVIGKLLSGLGSNRMTDRLLIGIGMMPRGEVGLVFASVGRTTGVLSDNLFAAIVLMVVMTTLITPPLLKSRYAKNRAINGY